MASRGRQVHDEDFGLDEVDAFNAEREKVLLDASGLNQMRARPTEEEDSEEEVLGLDDGSDSESEGEYNAGGQDDDDDEIFGEEAPEEEEEGWGGRNNYYGADEIDDEENAKQIEEEAVRQQKKHLEELNMDDYVDDDMMEEWSTKTTSNSLESSKQELPQQDISMMDSQARTNLLKSTYPEFVPLTKELQLLTPELNRLKSIKDKNSVINVKFISLSAYLGTITSYFAIFISCLESNEPFSMKDHPVMEGILSGREVWRQANELPEDIDEQTIEDSDMIYEEMSEEEGNGMLSSEEEESEASESESELLQSNKNTKSKDTNLGIDINVKRNIKQRSARADDFVEGDIADVDAEEKRARKRTLRFYTSKIDQAATKKDAKYTGDMDLPYRERLFERQQRLIDEARKRGQSGPDGADLDDNDLNSGDERDAKNINDEFDDSYYNTVKQDKSEKKTVRKQAHNDAVKAAKEGKLAELKEEVGNDGKRAVNYQIMKNKGLTPHRKKDDRNSRVKKRKKYEKAQKKLKSVRAVFSEQKGAYEGEKTGIKKGITRSVKLV